MELNEWKDPTDKRGSMQAKLKGQFKVDIKETLPAQLKITNFANDYMSYYMHKNGHFLKRITTEKSMDDIKREKRKDQLMHILDQYKDVDKDLEEVRQGKIDKVRQFYQSRFNTNASKSSLHKGGVGIFDNAKLSLSVESIQMDDNGL